MKEFENSIKKIKYEEPIYFNEENFNMKQDERRYLNYLYNYILKYIDDKKDFKESIQEQKFLDKGIFETTIGNICVVPTRVNLLDELESIKYISKFVNYKNAKNYFNYSISEDIIPTFNQYEYLKQTKKGLEQLYLLYKKNIVMNSLRINEAKRRNSLLPEIYSYFVLIKRKDDYDINLLNKINASSKTLEKSLKRNGYNLE